MRIENAKIMSVDLSMEDHGILCLEMKINGDGWRVNFGHRAIGKGYLGATEFKGYEKGIEEIMRIMNVVGVSHFNEMEGKYVRVVIDDPNGLINKIGNIVEDKWFDYREFYGN